MNRAGSGSCLGPRVSLYDRARTVVSHTGPDEEERMQDDLLDEALEAWEDARGGVIAEAENVPADRYGFRPEEEVRSVRELLLHIMRSR